MHCRELLPPETGLAFDAMRALRTELADEEAFVQLVDEVQRPRATAWWPLPERGLVITAHHFAQYVK